MLVAVMKGGGGCCFWKAVVVEQRERGNYVGSRICGSRNDAWRLKVPAADELHTTGNLSLPESRASNSDTTNIILFDGVPLLTSA